MTREEQLESVRTAISQIEAGGQEYEMETETSDGSKARRKVQKADLKALYKREIFLVKAIARENGHDCYQVEL